MTGFIRRFLANECAASLVEYTLLGGLVAMAGFGALAVLGVNVAALADTVAELTAL